MNWLVIVVMFREDNVVFSFIIVKSMVVLDMFKFVFWVKGVSDIMIV